MHIITALPVGNLARVMTPVSLLKCEICTSFTEEQLLKISQRKHYVKKEKRDTASSKDDELDLLGDDMDLFTGSHADLESAADNLFTSPHASSVPTLQFIVYQNTSKNWPTHPRYCLTAED